jgi:RimJ/RimL family protein N-acetyltransferase
MTVTFTEGEGLGLRPPQESDVERAMELYRDPDQLLYGLPAGVPLPESPADLVERMTRARDRFATVEPCDLTIVAADAPGRFLGTISWRRDVPALLRVADVGYAVHPDARGQGVAGRALRLMVQWLTADPDGPRMARVQLDHSIENPASCRTALAAGMDREGVRRGFLPLRDADAPDGVRRHDVCLHGILADPVLPPR